MGYLEWLEFTETAWHRGRHHGRNDTIQASVDNYLPSLDLYEAVDEQSAKIVLKEKLVGLGY